MLNRRLWILFVALVLGFVVLGLRLAKLQIADSQEWRDRLAQFLHPQRPLETYRGTIFDRNGAVLAQDVPSDELAIDYRAMNLDDSWLTKKAIERLRNSGEWGHFRDRAQRNQRLDETKAAIAGEIETIPERIAGILAAAEHVPLESEREEILGQYSDIRERIHAMKEDVWTRTYNRNAAQAPSTGDSGADTDDSALDAMFRQIQIRDELSAHTLRANIPSDAALYFKQHIEEFPGVMVRDMAEHNRRDYPFGESMAHLVGTLRSVTPEFLAGRRFVEPNLLVENSAGNLGGYLPGDHMGATGIEALVEETLHGTRGEQLLDLSENGPAVGSRRIDPVPGQDVKINIDASLQNDIYSALKDPANCLSHPAGGLLRGEDNKDHFAALVVLSMDGQLLAAVSYPSYDPATLDTSYAQLNNDVYRTPLLNRAIRGMYQPGSTVKPLLASAALTERVITPEETITCIGHFFPTRPDIFRCDAHDGHGPIELVDAISKSCNVYFYTVGQRLGIERLAKWYGNYGFGSETGMELPEGRGSIPDTHMNEEEAKADALFLGIGQGPIAVTPLQMANAYATLLRGGVAIPPRILQETPVTRVQRIPISPQILAVVRRGMEQCTRTGTGHETFGKLNLRVAGKTGTAETPRAVFDDQGKPVDDPSKPLLNADKTPRLKPDGTPMFRQLVETHDDAWFVGYAPADNPQFVVAAVMEWGGHGGAHAAPMVKEAFLQLQKHNYLPHMDVP